MLLDKLMAEYSHFINCHVSRVTAIIIKVGLIQIQGDPKKRAPTLIRPHFLVFSPNEMKLWS